MPTSLCLPAWNLGCGFAQNKGQLILFHFLTGLGGSAPLSIRGGVLGDCWRAEQRGKANAIYSLAPLLGPVLGPVCGAWIAEKSTWRWVFVIVQLLGIYMAFIYGLVYLFLTTMPSIFEGVYHEMPGIAGLHYLALGVGLSGTSQINARTSR